MDKSVSEIIEKLIAGIQEYEIFFEYGIDLLNDAKKVLTADFKDYSYALEYHRTQQLIHKNMSLGAFSECRALQKRLTELSAFKKENIQWIL